MTSYASEVKVDGEAGPRGDVISWEPDPSTLKRGLRTAAFVAVPMAMMFAYALATLVDLALGTAAEEMSGQAVTVLLVSWVLLTWPVLWITRRSMRADLSGLALSYAEGQLAFVRPNRKRAKKGPASMASVRSILLVEGNNRFGTYAFDREATEILLRGPGRWGIYTPFLSAGLPTDAFPSLEAFVREVAERSGLELEVRHQRHRWLLMR